ncbi:MAG: carboxypeptidase-like regulatory domain-containing protein [Cytophagales bacterium]|nr:carboxypeptidase-like regulatory domain-containing protein [Cytophagales bacterium]
MLGLSLLLAALPSAAQSFRISGRVTDAETGEGMPFVNVFFKGTTTGATTDFDGNYKLAAGTLKD